jgi:hypothetical protein
VLLRLKGVSLTCKCLGFPLSEKRIHAKKCIYNGRMSSLARSLFC